MNNQSEKKQNDGAERERERKKREDMTVKKRVKADGERGSSFPPTSVVHRVGAGR